MVLGLVFGTTVWLGAVSSRAEGTEAGDLDDIKREVKTLRSQLQTLRAAISEAAELDRQKAAILAKAGKGASTATAAVAPEVAVVRDEPAPRPPARAGSGAPSLPAARTRASEPVGTVRGKVQLPAGEPVAYVYVENVFAPAVKAEKVVIEQVHKQFSPAWAVIQRGTTVEFPNLDKIYHNVFSPSSGNSFDLGLYNSSSSAKAYTFNDPGSVDIFCNIHPQMAASILVVPNRHFAKVRPDGAFEINDVPGGKRKVVAWAPGSKLAVQWVDLAGGEVADLAFALEGRSANHKNKNGQVYGSYQ